MRRPPVVLGMAFLTALALLVALGLILFSVNPGVDRNEGEIKKAVDSQHAIICAQVQVAANSYRFRSLTPSGDVEPIRHFLTRMQAQQQTLRLARGSECKSAPGFPPVGLQVKRALHQINEILMHFEPKMREPVSRNGASSHSSGHRHESFSPAFHKPPNAGIGEEGAPAKLHDQLQPSVPVLPENGRRHGPPPPPEIEAPEPTPVAPEPKDPGGPQTNLVDTGRPDLPTAGIPAVEVKLNPTEGTIHVEVPGTPGEAP